MMKRIIILFLAALMANAQTNRCAFDLANSAVSYRDYIPDDLYNGKLASWYPFLVSPTNASTYASGSAGKDRATLQQTVATNRPTWTTNGMFFDGVNDRLVSSGQPTGLFYGVGMWLLLTNTVTATNAAKDIFTRRADTVGQTTKIELGSATGLLTNETITLIPTGTARVGITNPLAIGWNHVCVVWQTTNYSIFLNGTRPNNFYANSANPAVSNVAEYWIGADISSTSSFLSATVDDVFVITNTCTDAEVGLVYTNGARNRGI